jgi:endonuclease G, mitochondrial
MNDQKRAWRAILLLAATLAAITLAFLAGCSSIKNDGAAKRDTAAPRSAANLISPHLPFGNPSEAGRAANNRLVLRRQFAASWNASKQIPNWVAWRLVASDIGDTERSQFYADKEIDTPSPKDYTGSGYDRGHLCPSKDRSDTPENNKAVFTMLNIFPQIGDNNRGPWEKAERFERELAMAGREVYVIAGGVGSKTSFNSIDVPEFTWKVIVALERGKSWPDGQEKGQVFAVIMPNNDEDIEQDDRWQEYQANVPEIEKKTGYRFFRNAPIIESIAKTAGRF